MKRVPQTIGTRQPREEGKAEAGIGAILCGIAINLVPNALPASAPIAAAGHSLSIVHWTCAAFLAVMVAYNLVRPLGMGHRKPR